MKEELKIEVLKIGGKWRVQFSFGVQFFTLDYSSNKNECEWMARMLRKFFANYKSSIKDNSK